MPDHIMRNIPRATPIFAMTAGIARVPAPTTVPGGQYSVTQRGAPAHNVLVLSRLITLLARLASPPPSLARNLLGLNAEQHPSALSREYSADNQAARVGTIPRHLVGVAGRCQVDLRCWPGGGHKVGRAETSAKALAKMLERKK